MKPRVHTASSFARLPTSPAAPVVRPTQVAPGLVLAEKYALVREIGRGGMGVVWLAERLGWNAPVAVKLMTLPDTPIARARFEREVRLAATLRSPHVVQVLDHGVDEQTRSPYLVMELLEGESLAHRQRRLGKLSQREVLTMVSQLERALTKAHDLEIGHRDLKPDNIFLVPNGGEVIVKILDFGVAKSFEVDLLDTQAVTVPGNTVGTPWYMSPEQLRGASSDTRGDLWSLAVIVCECLTGQRPFQAPDLAMFTLLLWNEKRPVPSSLGAVPPGFDEWFAKATHRDIDHRFASAAELLEALHSICPDSHDEIPPLFSSRHSLPPASVAPAFSTSVAQQSRRSKGLLGLVAGTAIGLGAASAYFWERPARVVTAAPAPVEVTTAALRPAALRPAALRPAAVEPAPLEPSTAPLVREPKEAELPQPSNPIQERASVVSKNATASAAASAHRPRSSRKPRAKRRPSKSGSRPAASPPPPVPAESGLALPTRQEL